jgi:hypothetical protein
MSAEDLEQYEADLELQLYREYKDVCPMFGYVVETERRFYLANSVQQTVREVGGRAYIELELQDAWVWDMYRASRFVPSVRIATFKDVNVEELPPKDV